jgi:V8-like Glu-specific endopeptidase
MKIKSVLFIAIVIAFVTAVSFIISGSLRNTNQKQINISNTETTASKQEIGVDIGIVTAIMYVDGTPLAVVDGVILREGQSIRQVKVVKINSDSVEFEYDGTRWSQQVNKPRSTQCISTINSRMLSKNLSVEDIVKYVSPSVVMIVVYDDTGDELGMGSGFFIGSGKILTNAHVIKSAYSAEVYTLLKTYEDVTITKRDDDLDLAVLEVQSVGEPIVSLADDSELRVGQRVLAIGNPEYLERTVSDGLISAIRNLGEVQYIQISVPISGGSSGGPLLNMQGLVIGVTSSGIDEGQNLNFAVGIETIKRFLRTPDNPDQLQKAGSYIPGKVVRKWVKYMALGIVALAIGLTVFIYILKRLYRLVTTPFRRVKIPNATRMWDEQNQIVALSSKKSERYWRSM